MIFSPLMAAARQSRKLGFSLIELMVAVAIVAILAAIAYPSYRDYVIRGTLPEATSALAAKRAQLELFFQDNRTYTGAPACNDDTTTSRYFDFSCTNTSATTYTLQAVGKGSMTGFTFTINQSGTRTTAAVPANWSQPSPNNCWVTKPGGVC